MIKTYRPLNFIDPESRFRQRVLWIIGCLLLIGAGLWALPLLQEALLIGFLAFIVISVLFPLVTWLEKMRIPRFLAVMLPVLVILAVAFLLLLPLSNIALEQLQGFLDHLPAILKQTRLWFNGGQVWLEGLARRYPDIARLPIDHFLGLHPASPNAPPMLVDPSPRALGNGLTTALNGLFSGLSGATFSASWAASLAAGKALFDLFTATLMAIFYLMDRQTINRYLLRFLPIPQQERVAKLSQRMRQGVGGYVKGQILFMLTTGTLTGIGLMILGVPFAVLLGALSGLLTVIPLIGANLALVLMLMVALSTSQGLALAFGVLGLSVVIQFFENNVFGPLIMRRTVGLHPLATFLAILIGGMVFGFTGLLLAIPVTSCLHNLIEEFFLAPLAVET